MDLPPGYRFHHIGIIVRDLDAAEETYRLLGFGPVEREDVPDQGVRVAVLSTGRADEFVELLAPIADGPLTRFLERRGEGIHHVAFAVPDIAAALAFLRSQGVPLIDETPRTGAHGWRVAFVHPKGADGALVELVEAVAKEQDGGSAAERDHHR